jgi:hypothetical protein
MAKSVKKTYPRIDFGLPSADMQLVTSVNGFVRPLSVIRELSKELTRLPSVHDSEDALQHDCYTVVWDKNFRHLCYGWHTPNGGLRDPQEAGKFKGMGVRRGIPDLIFITHGGRVIFVELKNGHHRREPDQDLFAHKAMTYGFADVYVCGTLREFAALMCHLFDVDPATLVFV